MDPDSNVERILAGKERALAEGETLARAVESIERGVLEERNLPISLRSLLAQELPALKRAFSRRQKGWREEVVERLRMLANVCLLKGARRIESAVLRELERLCRFFVPELWEEQLGN